MRQNMLLFDCVNIYREDTPLYHLRAETDIECWTSNHLGWSVGFGFGMFLIWVIILPSYIAYQIKKYKLMLSEPEIVAKYGFFYLGYKSEYYYWERNIFLRKIALILVVVICGIESATL